MTLAIALTAAAFVAFEIAIAQADPRPALAAERTFGVAGGKVLVHFAGSGADAPPAADADGNGVPDFVEQVAEEAERALVRFAALGFRAPIGDGALGGDGRVDIYLANLVAADGNARSDDCGAARCSGFAVAENDYAGFAYPSVREGIRSVVPHELFHLVQNAYAVGRSPAWTEGSAVWSVEQLYGDGCADFERFLPAFLRKTFRPLERSAGGFGDNYAYGAALWPLFLERRFGAGAVVAAWEQSEQLEFLDAIGAALAPRGTTLEAAFVEFTRWNAFTGARAAAHGWDGAAAWSEAPREEALGAEGGRAFVEGYSARYVPFALAAPARIALAPAKGLRVAGWVVADGGDPSTGVELAAEEEGGALAATLEAGRYTLVLTGLSPRTITTPVDIAIGPPPPPKEEGCAATRGSGLSTGAPGLVGAIAFALRRRVRVRRAR
ncbi:MAG: hypothetical protein KIT31_24800 [Deltaproteobacteria bacterium]|nr:hypothetical protein [Deltaproteobacteria bacterium]